MKEKLLLMYLSGYYIIFLSIKYYFYVLHVIIEYR